MDCRICRVDEESRKEWACRTVRRDPSTGDRVPVHEFNCFACPPRPWEPVDDCPICKGKGEWYLYICPRKYTTLSAHDTVTSVAELEKGTLPGSGGWMEQTAWFHGAVQIVRAEWSRHEKERRTKARRKGGK